NRKPGTKGHSLAILTTCGSGRRTGLAGLDSLCRLVGPAARRGGQRPADLLRPQGPPVAARPCLRWLPARRPGHALPAGEQQGAGGATTRTRSATSSRSPGWSGSPRPSRLLCSPTPGDATGRGHDPQRTSTLIAAPSTRSGGGSTKISDPASP